MPTSTSLMVAKQREKGQFGGSKGSPLCGEGDSSPADPKRKSSISIINKSDIKQPYEKFQA